MSVVFEGRFWFFLNKPFRALGQEDLTKTAVTLPADGQQTLTRPTEMSYFRFCTDYTSPYTNQPYGIFIAVWHLVRDGKVSAEDEVIYWKARAWFESTLPIPPYYAEGNPEKAITWFKESAMSGHIVSELSIYQEIASRYGTAIELISTKTPGRIIYEDDYQIGATGG